MVLKKSKGSFAVTGNTIRRGGKKWMQKALKAAYISNRTGNRDGSREGQWDGKGNIIFMWCFRQCTNCLNFHTVTDIF